MSTKHSFWTHGNALTIESPENISAPGRYGWGADIDMIPGKSSWFHIPLSSPQTINGSNARLSKLYLFFNAFNCSIRDVHIYDGSVKVHEFGGFFLEEEHRIVKDTVNTFILPKEHVVQTAIGISFFCIASIGFDSPIATPRLIVASAGADYTTGFDNISSEFANKKVTIGIIKQ